MPISLRMVTHSDDDRCRYSAIKVDTSNLDGIGIADYASQFNADVSTKEVTVNGKPSPPGMFPVLGG